LASLRGCGRGHGGAPMNSSYQSLDMISLNGDRSASGVRDRSDRSASGVRDRSADSEGFQKPAYELRQQRKRAARKFITGTGVSGAVRGAPEPSRDLFIYRVDCSKKLMTCVH
jgi:hypothetical protein